MAASRSAARRMGMVVLVAVVSCASPVLSAQPLAGAAPAQPGEGCPRTNVPDLFLTVGGGTETVAPPSPVALDVPIQLSLDLPGTLLAAAFDASGARLATLDAVTQPGDLPPEATLRAWDVASGRELAAWPASVNAALAISPDGDRIAIARGGSGGERVEIHSLSSPGDTVALPLEKAASFPHALEFDPTGTLLAVADFPAASPPAIVLWEIASAQESMRFAGFPVGSGESGEELIAYGHPGRITSITFSDDGSRLLTTGGSGDAVRLWEVASGSHLLCFETPAAPFRAVQARFDDSSGTVEAFSARSRTLSRWDASSGELLAEFHLTEWGDFFGHATIYGYALSPDMRSAVRWQAEPIAQWADVLDVQSGRPTATLYFPEAVTAAGFAPDGRSVLAAAQIPAQSISTHLYLWDRTLPLARALARHAEVMDAAVLAIAGDDAAAARRSLRRAAALLPAELPGLTSLRLDTELLREIGFVRAGLSQLDTVEALIDLAASAGPTLDLRPLWRELCRDDPFAAQPCERGGIQPPAAGWPDSRIGQVVSDGRLNVRGAPRVGGLWLYQLENGAFVRMLAADGSGRWYYVAASGGPGWVSAQYVEVME